MAHSLKIGSLKTTIVVSQNDRICPHNYDPGTGTMSIFVSGQLVNARKHPPALSLKERELEGEGQAPLDPHDLYHRVGLVDAVDVQQ